MSPQDEFCAALGRDIQYRRAALGMTQKDLAKAISVTSQQVQKYENGSNRIGTYRLSLIAKALKTTIANLTDGEKQSRLDIKSKGMIQLTEAYMSLPKKKQEIVRLLIHALEADLE